MNEKIVLSLEDTPVLNVVFFPMNAECCGVRPYFRQTYEGGRFVYEVSACKHIVSRLRELAAEVGDEEKVREIGDPRS